MSAFRATATLLAAVALSGFIHFSTTATVRGEEDDARNGSEVHSTRPTSRLLVDIYHGKTIFVEEFINEWGVKQDRIVIGDRPLDTSGQACDIRFLKVLGNSIAYVYEGDDKQDFLVVGKKTYDNIPKDLTFGFYDTCIRTLPDGSLLYPQVATFFGEDKIQLHWGERHSTPFTRIVGEFQILNGLPLFIAENEVFYGSGSEIVWYETRTLVWGERAIRKGAFIRRKYEHSQGKFYYLDYSDRRFGKTCENDAEIGYQDEFRLCIYNSATKKMSYVAGVCDFTVAEGLVYTVKKAESGFRIYKVGEPYSPIYKHISCLTNVVSKPCYIADEGVILGNVKLGDNRSEFFWRADDTFYSVWDDAFYCFVYIDKEKRWTAIWSEFVRIDDRKFRSNVYTDIQIIGEDVLVNVYNKEAVMVFLNGKSVYTFEGASQMGKVRFRDSILAFAYEDNDGKRDIVQFEVSK